MKFKVGDKVHVNRPDPDSGISNILSSFAAPLTITKLDGNGVYVDSSIVPRMLKEVFLFEEELDLAEVPEKPK